MVLIDWRQDGPPPFLRIIGAALIEMPYRVAVPVLDVINRQIENNTKVYSDKHGNRATDTA